MRCLLFNLLFAVVFLFSSHIHAQELNQLQIVGKAEYLPTEIIAKEDINGDFCAGIKIISEMDGFRYDSYNGVVDVDDKPGEDLVYVSPDERVLMVYHIGYEPLKIILSEIGIHLHSQGVWEIKILGPPIPLDIPIVIITEPDSAEIIIDGKSLGSGKEHNVKAGKHLLVLKKEGYQMRADSISVDAKHHFFEYTLRKATREVRISSVPENAVVIYENVEVGRTPCQIVLPLGNVELYLIGEWCENLPINTEVTSSTDRLHFRLTRKSGDLVVTSNIRDALVYVNGEYKGKTRDIIELLPGRYTINVEHTDYRGGQANVVIHQNKTTLLEVVLVSKEEIRQKATRKAWWAFDGVDVRYALVRADNARFQDVVGEMHGGHFALSISGNHLYFSLGFDLFLAVKFDNISYFKTTDDYPYMTQVFIKDIWGISVDSHIGFYLPVGRTFRLVGAVGGNIGRLYAKPDQESSGIGYGPVDSTVFALNHASVLGGLDVRISENVMLNCEYKRTFFGKWFNFERICLGVRIHTAKKKKR